MISAPLRNGGGQQGERQGRQPWLFLKVNDTEKVTRSKLIMVISLMMIVKTKSSSPFSDQDETDLGRWRKRLWQ